jgi:beta-phosphoglucomutase
MSNSKKLQAVIFDLDGVITDTAEYHYKAWGELADRLQIPFSRMQNEQLKGISRIESLEILLKSAGLDERFSTKEKEQLANEKNAYYVQLIQSITPSDVLPGILSFIDDVKAYGCMLGLASASKNASFVMGRLELQGEFDYIVDASTVNRGKPDPEIFLTAAEQLKVDPARCIGIEDAVAGVHSINAAGMFSVAIGDSAQFSHANLVLEETSKLSLSKLLQEWERW